MSDIMDYLYGPLSKNWCMYFYFFSIFYFLSIFICFFLFIRYTIGKNANISLASLMLVYFFGCIIAYIQMRILHGMCIKSSEPAHPSTKLHK